FGGIGREAWNELGSAGRGAIDVGGAPALDIAEIIHASTERFEMLGSPGSRIPICGTMVRCCARAASGHVAAAPPSSVMNARRFTRSPRRQGRAVFRVLAAEPLFGQALKTKRVPV